MAASSSSNNAAEANLVANREGRMHYTETEDRAMLQWRRNHPGLAACGQQLWKKAEEQQVTRHTWQSMLNRWKKHLHKIYSPSVGTATVIGSLRSSARVPASTEAPRPATTSSSAVPSTSRISQEDPIEDPDTTQHSSVKPTHPTKRRLSRLVRSHARQLLLVAPSPLEASSRPVKAPLRALYVETYPGAVVLKRLRTKSSGYPPEDRLHSNETVVSDENRSEESDSSFEEETESQFDRKQEEADRWIATLQDSDGEVDCNDI